MKARLSTHLIALLDPPLVNTEWRAPRHFHASGLRDCGRRQVLGLLGHVEKQVSKPEWTRAARFGDIIHDFVVGMAKGQGILEAAELPLEVDPEYNVSGRVDAVLNRNGNRRALEIKSMNAERYGLFFPGDQDKFEDAYAQTQWYLHSLKLSSGFILAVNRDNCQWKEFSVQLDDQYVLSLLARMKRLNDHLTNKTLPGREKDRCRFCGYHGTELCSKEEEWI